MHELTKVTLENEMDLILAHRRSMKLGEMAGLSLQAQTTFATAVSEISRTAIEAGKNGCLTLCVNTDLRKKYIVATIKDESFESAQKQTGINNARRLVDKLAIRKEGAETSIDLYCYTPVEKVDVLKIDEWRSFFRKERPISAYDEIKRRNDEMKDLAARVQESEARYKTLTDTLPLIIFWLDADNQVTYTNQWLTGFTGLNREQLNAGQWNDVIHPDDYPHFARLLRAKEKGEVTNLKLQCRLRQASTGDYLWHLVSLSPQNDIATGETSWIGFMADIHAQKEFEQTLQDNQELKEAQSLLRKNEKELQSNIQDLHRSNVELQQFAYIASHDLQEPVRKIIFYSDYLTAKHQQSLDEKGVAYLNSMTNAARRMRDLIRDLLTFSQVAQTDRKFEQVNLSEVVQGAIDDLEMAIKETNGTIHVDRLPQIEGNAMLLRQLFVNLISNSLKYTGPETSPRVEITHEVKGDSLLIYCKDNGIGFDEKYLGKLFTLFQRLHNRDKYSGTGLGLAICRKIAEAHDGLIRAASTPGQGAIFTIILPFKQEQ
jgi:PAS domain S-box-containing protein